MFVRNVRMRVNKKDILAWVPSHIGMCHDNKLFQIYITVRDFYVSMGLFCREELVITRAHIGHTFFTHGYVTNRYYWTISTYVIHELNII